MSQSAKAQEPSMEEILASIRRIIADDEGGKSAKASEPPAATPVPKPVPVLPPVAAAPPPRPASPPAANRQDAVDAMLADFDAVPTTGALKLDPANSGGSPAGGDVLDLTEAMTAAAPSKPASSFRTIDGASDVIFSDRPPEPPAEPAVRSADEPRRQFVPSDRSTLLSNATASAVDNAFNSLAHTVLGNNARTLEDLVKEMLRPMLKSWLDDNLPGLVERIVRAEIERVSRGRG